MALSDPLILGDFQLTLKVNAAPFRLQRFEESSGVGTGQIITAEIAPPKWTGTMDVVPVQRRDGLRIVGVLDALGTSRRVRLYDPTCPFPASDPSGSGIGFDAQVLSAIGSEGKSIRLANLPGGFWIRAGDMISIGYGGGSRWLGRAVEDAQASAGGQTPLFEVTPHLPASISAGANAGLRYPYGLFVVTSFDPGRADAVLHSGISFSFLQVPS